MESITNVLLVTTTKVETQAVLFAAEKIQKIPATPKYINSKTYYDLGVVGNVQTWLVRSEMGSLGSGGSTLTILAGIKALSPSHIIMVGIAFGINDQKQSIGDILISQQIQEYELQKVATNSENQEVVIPRGDKIPSSTMLLDRFRDGELFWKECKVHFGLILSGLKLVDNANFKNQLLKQWPEAIGGEMEGTGLYSAANLEKTNWILVKAICDWAEKKDEKKENRQEIAATNAANFVFHVLQRGGLNTNVPAVEPPLKETTDQGTIKNKPKRIVFACSSSDIRLVAELQKMLETRFTGVVIDIFDFDNGSNLVEIIQDVTLSDKWFIIIASEKSSKSSWVTYEARILTLLSLEKESYRILTFQIGDLNFPKDFELELRQRKYIDATNGKLDSAKMQLMQALEEERKASGEIEEFFVNRGVELDRLEVEVTRQKVIHLIGMPGIGKTSLVRKSARAKFRRNLIQVDIRLGHNLELLSREIISRCNGVQPSKGITDAEIAQVASQLVIKKVAEGGMLYLNNAQNAMDDEGILRPYFRDFINLCLKSNISFPIFISSLRKTEIMPDDEPLTLNLRVDGLSDDFMVMIVKYWLRASSLQKSIKPPSDEDIRDLVKQFGGYPIAARILSGSLLFESSRNLLQSTSIPKYQRRIAEYIILSISSLLNDLDQRILQTIAIYGTGITTQQIVSVTDVAAKGLEVVQESISKLSGLMLIEQEVDKLKLHPTLSAFYIDQSIKQNSFLKVARDLADSSWKEAQKILYKLSLFPKSDQSAENPRYVQLNKSLLIAVEPAHRLLLATGQIDKAKDLPYKLQGHLREMVFVMYQQVHDHKTCVDFALQWLKIEPKDVDVQLYLARAYRQLREYSKAQRILEALEHDESPAVKSKVYRERGIIASGEGEITQAIKHFRMGRLKRRDGRLYYPLINANLAMALIAEADKTLSDSKEKQQKYYEAVKLFDEAKDFIPRFDESYLDMYINAKLDAGMINEKKALKMLEEAARYQFDNPRLYYRIAEILSSDAARLDDAIEYAKDAHDLGLRNSTLTIAKIQIMRGRYSEALDILSDFQPETPRDELVYDVLRVRAYKNDPEKAREILKKYAAVNNSFLARARIQTEINASEICLNRKNFTKAKEVLDQAKNMTDYYSSMYSPNLFSTSREAIEKLEKRLK